MTAATAINLGGQCIIIRAFNYPAKKKIVLSASSVTEKGQQTSIPRGPTCDINVRDAIHERSQNEIAV